MYSGDPNSDTQYGKSHCISPFGHAAILLPKNGGFRRRYHSFNFEIVTASFLFFLVLFRWNQIISNKIDKLSSQSQPKQAAKLMGGAGVVLCVNVVVFLEQLLINFFIEIR